MILVTAKSISKYLLFDTSIKIYSMPDYDPMCIEEDHLIL